MKQVDFVAGNAESKAVLDLNGIHYNETDGFSVQFPDSVQISSDQDEFSQPSYWQYDVPTGHGTERFVYPLDTQTLVVE